MEEEEEMTGPGGGRYGTQEADKLANGKLKGKLATLLHLMETTLVSGRSRAAALMNSSWIICPLLLFVYGLLETRLS